MFCIQASLGLTLHLQCLSYNTLQYLTSPIRHWFVAYWNEPTLRQCRTVLGRSTLDVRDRLSLSIKLVLLEHCQRRSPRGLRCDIWLLLRELLKSGQWSRTDVMIPPAPLRRRKIFSLGCLICKRDQSQVCLSTWQRALSDSAPRWEAQRAMMKQLP